MKNTVPYYIRKNDKVYLVVPPLKINDYRDDHKLTIYVDEKQVYSNELFTKISNVTIKKEFDLNKLLKESNSIKVRVIVTENDEVLFDSDKNGITSLHREFIIFWDKKELLASNYKPTNYFVYSLNFDSLEQVPEEVTHIGNKIYNIYPKVGENIIGKTRAVFFRK